MDVSGTTVQVLDGVLKITKVMRPGTGARFLLARDPNPHLNGMVADVETTTSHLIYESGQLEVDLARRELRVRGVPVPIGGRAFEIIEVLVQAAGELVTKNHLMKRVRPGPLGGPNTPYT